MFTRRRDFLRLRLVLADGLVTAFAFFLAYSLRQNLGALREFYLQFAPLVVVLSAALATWTVMGLAVGVYQQPGAVNVRTIAGQLFRQAAAGSAALGFLLYLFKLADVSRLFLLLFVAANTVLLFAWRLVWLKSGRSETGVGNTPNFVIVGTAEEAAGIAHLIVSGGGTPARILAFVRASAERDSIPDESAVLAFSERQGCLIAEMDEFSAMLRRHVVDEVVFAVDRQRLPGLQEIFRACEEEGVRVRAVVNFFPATTSLISFDTLHRIPMLTFSPAPDNDYLLFAKRIFDVIVASCMAILFLPALLTIALAIRLTSRGPAFFVQERCGLNGRRFRLYKLRSMCANASAERASVASLNEMDGPVFKCADDPRITPIGRFIRRYSIDEWPQIWNVIRGDMSLVGPRPPLPEEVEQYKPWQRRRLRMRPGLTCLWVLEGRNRLDFLSWMRSDLQYIDHWSLALDCRIVLQSIPHVLSGKGM